MGKPINKTVGQCECSQKGCDQVAEVRRIRNEGDYYIDCPIHGTIRHKGVHDYVLDNARLFNPDGLLPHEKKEQGAEKKEVEHIEVVATESKEVEKAQVVSIDKNKKPSEPEQEEKPEKDWFDEM